MTNARLTYYSVPFAPYGRLDGTQVGTGNIATFTQANLNQEAAVASPFTITAAHQWQANADSLSVTVNLAAVSAFAPTNGNLKLRVALIEHLQYATAPGTNGEREFHNVVREMYPDAGGTQLANAWTAGQTRTLTLRGRVPAYVDRGPSNNTRVVVWIQNDTNKEVAQAMTSAYVPLQLDLVSSLGTSPGLVCATSNASHTPVVTLTNAGTSTITTATIYHKLDRGAWQTYSWTGSLAPQGTTNVNLPTLSLAPGSHILTDSVARPNGQPDMNRVNDRVTSHQDLYNTAGTALPLATGFENNGALPANWVLYDENRNGNNWATYGRTNTGTGHNGSDYMLYHSNYDFLVGEENYAIIPADNFGSGAKELEFYNGLCQFLNSSGVPVYNDALSVMYSDDCGASWNSAWRKLGAQLANGTPATATRYVPTASQWTKWTVDLSNVPANAMLAFKATSSHGNNLYIDDVTLRAAPLATTPSTLAEQSITLAPNPATDQAILAFGLRQRTVVEVSVVDALGRAVGTPTTNNLAAGAQQIIIGTAGFAPGLYNVIMHTADGNFIKRLAVVR